jgi:hypothetical protein
MLGFHSILLKPLRLSSPFFPLSLAFLPLSWCVSHFSKTEQVIINTLQQQASILSKFKKKKTSNPAAAVRAGVANPSLKPCFFGQFFSFLFALEGPTQVTSPTHIK